jgi:uncharacterized protein YceK
MTRWQRRTGRQGASWPGAGQHQMVRAMTVVLAALACLAGCGSVRPGHAVAGGQTAARPGGPVAGTQAEGEALARRLLSALVLPSGARRLPDRPVLSTLRGPAFYPAGRPYVDLYRYFWLPVTTDAAQRYLRAHPPAGLAFDGTGTAGLDITVLMADVPPRIVAPGVAGAEMQCSLVPAAGGGSLLRADVEVIVYPPRSAAEYLDPARVKFVTVSATGSHTVSRIVTARSEISTLARLIDGLPALPGADQPMSCPMITTNYRLAFTLVPASGPSFDVETTICAFVTVVADGASQPELADTGGVLVQAVERLLHLDRGQLPQR